jgi:hypothetical protein
LEIKKERKDATHARAGHAIPLKCGACARLSLSALSSLDWKVRKKKVKEKEKVQIKGKAKEKGGRTWMTTSWGQVLAGLFLPCRTCAPSFILFSLIFVSLPQLVLFTLALCFQQLCYVV